MIAGELRDSTRRQVVCCGTTTTCPEQEVGVLLGCSTGTVKSQAAKGLAKLRAALGAGVEVEESR